GQDSKMRVVEIATGKELVAMDMKGINLQVAPILSPDGRLLAARCQDYLFRVWEMSTGQLLYTSQPDPGGRVFGNQPPRLTADCRCLMVPSPKPQLIEMFSGLCRAECAPPAANVTCLAGATSSDGTLLAGGYADGTVVIVDVVQDKELVRLK